MKWKLLTLCAVSLTMLMASQTAFGVDVQYQVAASGDDTYWMNADGNWTTAQEAYCPYINNTRGGAYRWQLDIPQGATIVSAVMKLKATGANGNVSESSLTLEVLDYDSCPSFAGGMAPQADSVMSGVAALWSIPTGDWTANEWYSSCDMTDLVQAFVDRQNYASGNYIGIRATSGAGSYHKTFQYDSAAANAPILEVSYTTAAQEKTITLYITNPKDDAKCLETGILYNGNNIYFPYLNTTRRAIWRFKSYIPPNATITDARMNVKMLTVAASDSTARMQMFDYDHCPVFSVENNPWNWDLADPSTLYTDWVLPSTLAVNDWAESPDISAILQAFIDRQADPLDPESTGYVFGNYLGISGTPVSGPGKQVYNSYIDDLTCDPDRAAQIDVTFTGGDAIVRFYMADPHVRISQPIYVWTFNAEANDTLTVKLIDPQLNETILFQQAGGLELENEICFDADWSNLTTGQYTLTATITAPNSTVRGSESYTWTRLHNGIPKVGIDRHNNICLRDANGDPQPFIPVTSWMLGKGHFPTHPVFPRINTLLVIGYYPEKNVTSWLDYLSVGEAAGLFAAGPGAWATKAPHQTWYNTDPNDLISFINASKQEPGLLAWFWMDEPDLYQSPGSYIEPITTRDWTTLSHQYDTDHPVWVNYCGGIFSPNSSLIGRTKSLDWMFETNEHVFGRKTVLTDIVGIDYYPYEYTTKYDNVVLSDYILALDNVRLGNRDLCPTAVFIETQDVRDPDGEGHDQPYSYWLPGGPYVWTPDPEPRMLKNEFWLSLIHGAKAISYFHYFCPIPVNLQDVMTEFVADVTALTPVLCSPEDTGLDVSVTVTNATGDPQDPNYLANPRVDFTTRIHGDPGEEVIYIFAADLRDVMGATKEQRVVGDGFDRTFNYSSDVVSARFTIDGLLPGTTISVYGEARTITSGNGFFDDTFDPYAVHIYMIGGGGGQVQASYQVAASGDDTYWMNADGTWTTAQEAYCPYINNTRGGAYRWQLDIPDGATVVSAVMKLKATGANGTSGTSALTLEVLDHDSCPSFAGGTAPQIDSVMSGIAATWSIPTGDWTANEWYESCDVTDLVQGFIDRQNYASGNYIGIRATSGTGTYHKTFQYDSGAANGAILEVIYTTP